MEEWSGAVALGVAVQQTFTREAGLNPSDPAAGLVGGPDRKVGTTLTDHPVQVPDRLRACLAVVPVGDQFNKPCEGLIQCDPQVVRLFKGVKWTVIRRRFARVP